MLILPPSVRIFLAAGATDLRLGFDGLSGRVREVLGRDVLSGAIFLFCILGISRKNLWEKLKNYGMDAGPPEA